MKRGATLWFGSWVAALAILVTGCGGSGGSGGGNDGPTATRTVSAPTVTATPTETPGAGAAVVGLVVLRRDVAAGAEDAVGAPPQEWNDKPGTATFDRALSHADWTVDGEPSLQGVTGTDGRFRIDGLAPGQHTLWLSRTLDGNLVLAQVPFVVGPNGAAEVIAEVAWGLVRASSTYADGSVLVREIFGPDGMSAVLRDGAVVRIAGPGVLLVDADGDGQFDGAPCDQQVWDCSFDRECGEDRVCQCTASCPDCEDCGPPVCVSPAAATPYRCGDDGTCARPGDRCVCVSSCPACDDCQRTVCVPPCGPVEIEAITIQGPSQVVAGQDAWLSARAHLSSGTTIDVTHLVEWESSAPEVLSVDSWGHLTALESGVADLTASLGEVTSLPWRIEVTARPTLTRIHVQNVSCYYPLGRPMPAEGPAVDLPAPPETGDILPSPQCGQVVRIGGTLQFSAIGEFGDGLYYEDITQRVAWQASPPGVGEVIAGRFTGLAQGSAQVTASLEGITSDPTEVRVVTEPTVVYLSIYAMDWAYPAVAGGPVAPGADVACWDCGWFLTVLRGDQVRFGATVQYDTGEWEDVTDRVTWRSNDAAVATVDGTGLMTAAGAGEAQIDAVLDDVTSNPVDVRVVNEATLQSIWAYPEGTDRVVGRGDQLFFRATGQYDVGLSRDVTREATWRSSDASVGGFDEPGVFTGRAAGVVRVWAEIGGLESEPYSIEVYATGELDYCEPDGINRDVWSDAFNRVVLESDCANYALPGVVTLRYTVTETQPHGGIFDPCLDLYVFQGERRVRTLREEGCGEPFLPAGAPERDEAVLKYQLLAFWDLKDDSGNAVPPGTYTIHGRFFLYYDPVVSIDVTVGGGNGTPVPTARRFAPTPTPPRICEPPRCGPDQELICPDAACSADGCGLICVSRPVCTPPPCGPGEVFHCPGGCPGGCGTTCATRTPTQPPLETDLSGDWTVTIPDLNLSCPAFIRQDERSLTIAIDCAGLAGALEGSVDSNGAFRASGSIDPLCPTTHLAGNVLASGNAIEGKLGCEVFEIGFAAVRGQQSVTPTPARTPTPIPPGTPGAFDLSGSWLISVPEIGYACPADIRQTGSFLDVRSTCSDFPAEASGNVNAAGAFSLTGSFSPLCPDLTILGNANADGSQATGRVLCGGIEFAFEATRNPQCSVPRCQEGYVPVCSEADCSNGCGLACETPSVREPL